MQRAVGLVVLVACKYTTPGQDPGDDVDAPISPEGCVTFSAQLDTCLLPPELDLVLPGPNRAYRYDTDDGGLDECDAGLENCSPLAMPRHSVANGIDFLVVKMFTLAAGNRFVVVGNLPVAVIASGAISIEGTIDLIGGAGNRTSTICDTSSGRDGGVGDGSGSTTGTPHGGAGGGGGGFARPGAAGGNADNPGGAGGAVATLPAGLALFGGCAGGEGGSGPNGGGDGGAGGGAIYIASGVSITIGATGAINAGGERGRRGDQNDGSPGGGGGGSGGMIWLETPVLVNGGAIAANGGGGGEGTSGDSDGQDGSDGLRSATPAPGGTGGDSLGGDGGAGDANSGTATAGAGQFSGGGGGGGVGVIRISGAAPDGTISPSPTL